MGQLEVLVQEAAAVPHQDLFRRQVETVVISILSNYVKYETNAGSGCTLRGWVSTR